MTDLPEPVRPDPASRWPVMLEPEGWADYALLDSGGGEKFERYGIGAFSGMSLALPLIEGCIAWLECRRIPEPHSEAAYDTFFGEVLAAQADARVFAGGRWAMREDNAALHTLHHLGGGNFGVIGDVVQGQVKMA